MTAFDSFPLGRPAFVTHILDRAAHLRSDDAKLLTLEEMFANSFSVPELISAPVVRSKMPSLLLTS